MLTCSELTALLPLSACHWALSSKSLPLYFVTYSVCVSVCVCVTLSVALWLSQQLKNFFFFDDSLLRLGDLAGHGIGLAVGPIYAKVYGDRMFRSPMTELLLKSGRNGMSLLLPFEIPNVSTFNISGFRKNQRKRILYIRKGKQTKTWSISAFNCWEIKETDQYHAWWEGKKRGGLMKYISTTIGI